MVQFVYRNPHSFVHIEAPDENGAMQRWAVEWGGTSQLAQAGVKRDSLKVGDKVGINGRPSRVPGEYRVLMVNLSRPADGFSWGRNANEVVDGSWSSGLGTRFLVCPWSLVRPWSLVPSGPRTWDL